ncbi:MAG: invasin domain 3-containing protein [Candidatus Poribacteria bacterium]
MSLISGDVSISAEPQRIRADGKSQSKISINVTYPKENSVREPKPTLSLSPKLVSLSAIADNGDGTCAATYTAPEKLNKTTSVTLTALIGDKSEQVALEIIHDEVIIQKVAPESIKIGEITTLNGEIFPAIETDIELSFKHENQELNEPVRTDSQGKYQYKFTGTRAGAWKVTAKWGGDEQHQPSQSETLTFTVEKGKTQLAIEPPENLFSLTAGDFVTVSGKLTPSIWRGRTTSKVI